MRRVGWEGGDVVRGTVLGAGGGRLGASGSMKEGVFENLPPESTQRLRESESRRTGGVDFWAFFVFF